MNKNSSFYMVSADRTAHTGRWLMSCDHANNRIPPELKTNLGISPTDIERHIAYDIGALGVTLELSRLLNSPAIFTDFSRLVIDPNRGPKDPTLVMKLYDGTIIPANRFVDDSEVERRLAAYHRPYHDALAQLAAQRDDTVICAIHFFTPQLKAHARRPWQLGILSGSDKRLTAPVIEALRASPQLNEEADKLGEPLSIGDNEPYIGYFPNDSIDTHATQYDRPNVLIELRSDLIETPDAQRHWAELLAPILAQTLKNTGL